MTASAQAPFPQMFDLAGLAVPNGYVYFGTANLDPQTNPVAVFWDRALTIAAPNPVRTTAGGYYATLTGAPGVIYTADDFSMAVHDHNNTRLYSAPSCTTAINSAAITFGAVIVSTSILPVTKGTGVIGSLAKAFGEFVGYVAKFKALSVFDTTQPAVAADLAKVSQLSVDLLVCRQTSTTSTAALVNVKNAATIVRDSAGVYTVTPLVALPASYVVEPHPAAFTAGTTPIEVVCTTRGTASLVISVRVNNVATDFAWDLVIKGNPAVADPIS